MKKFLKDRRGAALEMAIMLSVVTFALSTLVLTTSLLQHSRKIRAEKNMTQGIVLEQMGEDFCAAVARNAGDTWTDAYREDYDIAIEGTVLTVTAKETGEVLLKVVLTAADGGGYTVTEWNKK